MAQSRAMRVRIARAMSGVRYGVALSQFDPGMTYDLDTSLALELIEQRFAEEVPDSQASSLVATDSDASESIDRLTRGAFVMGDTSLPRQAAQHRHRRRKKDR